MSLSELEPMDRELADLLAVKKVAPEPDGSVRERVLASVLAQVGAVAVVGAAAARGGGGASVARRLVGAHPLASIGGALAVGIGVGAGVVAPRFAHDQVVYVDRVRPAASAAPAPLLVPPPAGEPMPTTQVRVAVAPAAPPKADGALESQRLASERALLDIARAALSRGEAGAAIDAARRHAEEFPNGQLAEEREAILIRGLVQVGDAAEARARAATFHARFPDSIFGRTIDAALRSIP